MSKFIYYLFLITTSLAIYFVAISPLYFGGGSIFPVSEGIVQLRELNKDTQIALAEDINLSSKIDVLEKQYESIDKQIKENLDVMIPDQIDPVRLISEANNIIALSRLPVENISYTSSDKLDNPKLPDLGVYSVSFSLNGPYSALKDILRNFETSMRLYSIRSLNLSTADKNSNHLKFNVKMDTYYLK